MIDTGWSLLNSAVAPPMFNLVPPFAPGWATISPYKPVVVSMTLAKYHFWSSEPIVLGPGPGLLTNWSIAVTPSWQERHESDPALTVVEATVPPTVVP